MPWIMKAGKALNERKVEIRVQYKPPAASIHGDVIDQMRNELVVSTPGMLLVCYPQEVSSLAHGSRMFAHTSSSQWQTVGSISSLRGV